MNKNDIAAILIEDMTTEGEGIGHADGFTLFVKDTVIGDTALVKVMKSKKTYGYARLMELVSPSPDRVSPACPSSRACGGCQLQCLSYEKQLEFKRNKVKGHLQRIGGFGEEVTEKILPTLGMKEPFRYRNKALIPFGEKDGRIVAGFYAGHTHSIIEQSDCLLTPEEYEQILLVLLNWAEQNRISVYNEATGKGTLRHVLLRKGFATGEIMVCLVIGSKNIPEPARLSLVEALTELRPRRNITSISLNVNLKQTNVVMGTDGMIDLYGPGYITDRIGEVSYRISPLSFYQVNPLQTEVLYGTALKYADLTGKETVWDLYCGIGTISLFLAKSAAKVFGVEIVPEAIRDAEKNAAENGITNATFFVGRSEEIMPSLYREDPELYRADVVVVDPPRKGCGEELLDTILQMGPERIVYVSCDSATLARDLKLLCAGEQYQIEAVQPVDMFPQSVHVETVVQLSKGDINQDSSERNSVAKNSHTGTISGYSKGNKAPETTNVKIDFSLENLDMSELGGKATYEQIKDYVREQTGFRVSTLFISQVKRKCGLEVGESYNKPKSEDARQPQCTPEKEEAIMQALRHYGVI